jgi:hypothetical protein
MQMLRVRYSTTDPTSIRTVQAAPSHSRSLRVLPPVAADILRRTVRYLATTPGGLRFSADSYDWLEGLADGRQLTHSVIAKPIEERSL